MAQFIKYGSNYGGVCPPKVSELLGDTHMAWAVSPDSFEDSIFAMYKVKNWTWLGFNPQTSEPYDNFNLQNGTNLYFGQYSAGHYGEGVDETIYICGGIPYFYTETSSVGGQIIEMSLQGLAINDDGTHAGTLWGSTFLGAYENWGGFFTASSSNRKWTFQMDGINLTLEPKELWKYEPSPSFS